MQHPTLFINVFQFKGVEKAEGLVYTDRAAAAEDAEEWSDHYRYTLTDAGVIDLSDDFSDAYHERVARDQETDRRIDEAKELLSPIISFTMTERA